MSETTCCDLHRETGKDDNRCLWLLPNGDATDQRPPSDQDVRAALNDVIRWWWSKGEPLAGLELAILTDPLLGKLLRGGR